MSHGDLDGQRRRASIISGISEVLVLASKECFSAASDDYKAL